MSSDPSENISAQIHLKTSLNDSLSLYDKLMSSVSNSKTEVLTDSELSREHNRTVEAAINCFRGQVKIGQEGLGAKYETDLRKELEKKLEDYKTFNKFKLKNKLELEEIDKLRKEQEVRERERVKLEEALRKIREENARARSKEPSNEGRAEAPDPKLEEVLRTIREENARVDLNEPRDEGADPKPTWIKIKESIERYGYPIVQMVFILSLIPVTYNYIKSFWIDENVNVTSNTN